MEIYGGNAEFIASRHPCTELQAEAADWPLQARNAPLYLGGAGGLMGVIAVADGSQNSFRGGSDTALQI